MLTTLLIKVITGKSDEGNWRHQVAEPKQQNEAGARQEAHLHGGCYGG